MLILVFDTETTGLPDWHAPSESPHQPHIVELAAILFDTSKGTMVDDLDTLIIPDGWESSPEALAAHGITPEMGREQGMPEHHALDLFMALHAEADLRVGHNESFDARILRIAMMRFNYPDKFADTFKAAPSACTMWGSKRARPRVFGKVPTLAEALAFWCGKQIEGAHRAMNDADACLDIYLAMQEQGCAPQPKALT